MPTIAKSEDRGKPLPGDQQRTPTAKAPKRVAGSMWRALVHPDMLVGSSLTRRLVVVAEDLRSLDRPIPQAELAARTGCHRATPGRLAVRYLGGIIERDRPGAGHAWTWIPDPDLSADDCRRPVGYVPLAAVDTTYAELIGLEPTTDIEATTAMARSVGARYDGRLRLGAAMGGLARDAGLSRRAYRAAEGRLVEKGYLTRTGRRGVWNGRLAHPDGVLGAALRQHWQAATRRWARRARPAVCGRFGALRRWDPFTRSIGSRAGRQRPLYTQCEPAANTPKRRMEGPEPGPRTPEAAKTATERGPPSPVVGVCDLENNTDPDSQRWQVLRSRPDWLGPGLEDVLRIARWTGVEAARAASLDVDHRIRTGRHPVRSTGAMTAGLAFCYAAEQVGRRCRWHGDHHCGPDALVADRARRYDEQTGHWRQAQTDLWAAPPPDTSTGDPAPLDADYYRRSLVPYLQETGADNAVYDTWGVPPEYRPATA